MPQVLHGNISILNTISPSNFHDEYYSSKKPVILSGYTKSWGAMKLWTPQWFVDTYKDSNIWVSPLSFGLSHPPNYEIKMPLNQFMDILKDQQEEKESYWVKRVAYREGEMSIASRHSDGKIIDLNGNEVTLNDKEMTLWDTITGKLKYIKPNYQHNHNHTVHKSNSQNNIQTTFFNGQNQMKDLEEIYRISENMDQSMSSDESQYSSFESANNFGVRSPCTNKDHCHCSCQSDPYNDSSSSTTSNNEQIDSTSCTTIFNQNTSSCSKCPNQCPSHCPYRIANLCQKIYNCNLCSNNCNGAQNQNTSMESFNETNSIEDLAEMIEEPEDIPNHFSNKVNHENNQTFGDDSKKAPINSKLGRHTILYCQQCPTRILKNLTTYFPHPDLFDCCEESVFGANSFFIGGKGIRTSLHYDKPLVDNLFCQIYGKKRFRLYAPSEREHFYMLPQDSKYGHVSQIPEIDHVDLSIFPDFEKAKPYADFILGPGDSLYIPKGWHHHVEHYRPSWDEYIIEDKDKLSISLNFWYY